jgi:methanethiol S-methyltransferase
MVAQHLLCALLWIVFCVLHSVLASGTVKRKTQAALPSFFPYYRLAYTLFAVASFAAVVCFQWNLDSPLLYAPNMITNSGGALIGVAGLLVMGICIKKYFLSLSGLKSMFRTIPAHQLMITGLHRYVRHPLYAGTFLAIWGMFVVVPYMSLLISNVIITGYTLLAIGYEEQKLVAEFGDDYLRYRKQVPRILPGFRSKQA